MKKINYSLLVLSLFVMFSCSTKPSVKDNEFVIYGKLLNVPDSVQLELLCADGKLLRRFALDTVIGGEFMFRDTITSGVRRVVLMSRSEGFPGILVDIWIAPGAQIEITGEDKLIKTWSIESDVQEQKEQNAYVKVTFPEQRKELEFAVEEQGLFKPLFEAIKQKNDAKRRVIWAKIDSIRNLQAPLKKIITKKELEYLRTTPVSNHWMISYLRFVKYLKSEKDSLTVAKIRALHSHMSDSDKQTDMGKEISAYLNPPKEVNIGDDMVDGDLYDMDGKLQNLSQFKGKYILLDFWSLGCAPCIESIPELDEISETYKDNLIVISISQDSKKSWQEYVTDKKMKGLQWNELMDVPKLSASYGVRGIPHYVLISPDAKVQSTWAGYGAGSLKHKLNEEIK